jgi:hypothetical protein
VRYNGKREVSVKNIEAPILEGNNQTYTFNHLEARALSQMSFSFKDIDRSEGENTFFRIFCQRRLLRDRPS